MRQPELWRETRRRKLPVRHSALVWPALIVGNLAIWAGIWWLVTAGWFVATLLAVCLAIFSAAGIAALAEITRREEP